MSVICLKRRQLSLVSIAVLFLGPGLAALVSRAGAAPTSAKRPNFIFLLADDLRWDALGATGHPFLETPNIDRIGREGAIFSNAFCTNSLCAPSRATFLTGQYAHGHGVYVNADAERGLPDSQPIFTDYLREAGYQTCFIGKHHIRIKPTRFDQWLGFSGQGKYADPVLPDFAGGEKKREGYIDKLLIDQAVAYLRQPRQDPFCLLVWFKTPHHPYLPAGPWASLFEGKSPPFPPSYMAGLETKPKAVRRSNLVADRALTKLRTNGLEKLPLDYLRVVAQLDGPIGVLLDALGELDLDKNTAVIFTSDHGYMLGEHGLVGKRLMYDPSIRIPLFVRYPRLAPGGGIRLPHLVSNADLAPTVLDLAGVSIPKSMHGQSWKPLLTGERTRWRKSLYYAFYDESEFGAARMHHGVRTESWKYIEYPQYNLKEPGLPFRGQGKWGDPPEFELYNLEQDPHEMKNLYGKPEYEDKIAELRRELERRRAALKMPKNN